MAKDQGWKRRFHQPIALPDGRKLVTLRNAGDYIAGLPPKTVELPHWQTAIRELLISAERGGILQLAEWAMLAAIHHDKPAPQRPARKRTARRYRTVR